MSRLSGEAHQFAGRFLFGGIVAVIALLNTDLLIDKQLHLSRLGWQRGLILALAILVISGIYFRIVAERILFSRWQYRLVKHKYDITLHALLMGCSTPEFLKTLEYPLEPVRGGKALPFPDNATFSAVADYLHDHHGRVLARLTLVRDWLIGMLIVLVTIVIKAVVYSLSRPA